MMLDRAFPDMEIDVVPLDVALMYKVLGVSWMELGIVDASD